jgi:predicted site-specific integrase-resolvase
VDGLIVGIERQDVYLAKKRTWMRHIALVTDRWRVPSGNRAMGKNSREDEKSEHIIYCRVSGEPAFVDHRNTDALELA